MNKLLIIGVGPGGADLLTKEALEKIKSQDVLFFPSENGRLGRAYEAVKSYIPSHAAVIPLLFPMIDFKKNENRINTALEESRTKILITLKNKKAALLVLGDPSIYATAARLKFYPERTDIEIVSAVPSFTAAANRAQIPLVLGDESLVLIPLSLPLEDIKEKIEQNDNIVLMKFHKNKADDLRRLLIDEGLEGHICIVSNLSTAEEKISFEINDVSKDLPYMTLIIIKKKEVLSET